MFAAHPDVFVPPFESDVFLEGDRVARARLRTLRNAAIRSSKRFLVEKTPKHVRRLDTLRRVAPNGQIVLVVRDGRDVAASIAKRYRDSDATRGIQRWIADNTIVLAERESEDVFVYRHEDLVANPEAIIRTICRFTAIPFHEAMLSYHRQQRLWFGEQEVRRGRPATNHLALRNWQVNQPIFDSRGVWKGVLSPAEVSLLIEGRGRVLMEAFGYLD